MGSRWTVLFGTVFVAATMSGMVVLGAPAAFAAPAETETTSATESEATWAADPTETEAPDAGGGDEEPAPDENVDVDTPAPRG